MSGSFPRGTNLTLTVSARGTEPISYQWRRGGIIFPGATETSLTLSSINISNSGAYDVVATNIIGMATSSVAFISVSGRPPVFTQQPVSVEVLQGSTVTLNPLASGSAPLSYRWYFRDIELQGQTNRQLVLTSITLASAGPYVVVVSNPFASATSSVAQVTVNQSLILQEPSRNQFVDIGRTVNLTAGLTCTDILSYS